MSESALHYELLPRQVRDNLSYEQWQEAQPGVIAAGPLLPVHDLAGARGQDDTQFHTSPPGAHSVP